MVEKVFGDAVMTFSHNEDENFREESKVVDEVNPTKYKNAVRIGRLVNWLTTATISFYCTKMSAKCLIMVSHKLLDTYRKLKSLNS